MQDCASDVVAVLSVTGFSAGSAFQLGLNNFVSFDYLGTKPPGYARSSKFRQVREVLSKASALSGLIALIRGQMAFSCSRRPGLP